MDVWYCVNTILISQFRTGIYIYFVNGDLVFFSFLLEQRGKSLARSAPTYELINTLH